MVRLLVTGGCGFIGSNFIRGYLNRHKKDKIINLDKLTYAGRKENLLDVAKNKRYTFVKGDINNQKVVSNVMKKADAVVHFAAESHVDRSIEDPFCFLKTGVIGTGVVLEEAEKNNVKKVVHVSTDEVYGDVPKGQSKENDRFKPSSPYSASKAGGDGLAYSYYHTFDLPVSIVRPSNNYGPYQFPEKVIPLFITNLLRDKKVPLYGTGQNKRDWLYVEDNCSAIEHVLKRGKNGEAYNIAGGNEITNLQLTKMILREMGKPDSMIRHVRDRLGHDKRYALDSRKIKKLGWKPKYKFKPALKKTIEWYSENERWWKPLVK